MLLNGDVNGRKVVDRLTHCLRDCAGDGLVENTWDDVVRRKLVGANHIGNCVCSDAQNLGRNLLDLCIQEATEQAREGQNVVDLVRVIATTGRND